MTGKWKSWVHQLLDLSARMDAADQFGALHIVVADGNVEDDHIEFCLVQPNITAEEAELARDLLYSEEGIRSFAWWLQDNPDAVAKLQTLLENPK